MIGQDELAQLYQDVIVDHNRSPRNFRPISPCSAEAGCRQAEGFNPLCGDKLHLYVQTDPDGRIDDLSFQGSGCAISVAAASLMTEALRGRTDAEAQALFDEMHGLLTGEVELSGERLDRLGKLAALKGVSAYPMRVKCATLCWHALQAALEEGAGTEATVTTE